MRTFRCSGRLGGGVCQGRGLSRGMYTFALWTESQTGVKTLPFRNFVCGWYKGHLQLFAHGVKQSLDHLSIF